MTNRTLYLTLVACAAVLVVAWLAPSGASAAPVWQAAGPDDAATVDFKAIATYSVDATHNVVVAVGQDKSTDSPGPVIYRRLDGAWARQALPSSLPSTACLNGISVTATTAWVIGNATGCTTGAPLALRFTGGGPELAKADTTQTWSENLAAALTAPLTSIALNGNAGYVGDAQGNIRKLTDDGAVVTFGSPLSATPQATAVKGLALTSGKTYAAGDNTLAGGGDVYEVSSESASSSPFKPDPGATSLVGVAATADTPLAIEPGAYWEPDTSANNLWTRRRPTATFTDAGTRLSGVDVAGSGQETTSAIAGATAAGGAVWLRSGPNGNARVLETGSWTKYTGLGTALEDAAVVAPGDVWAAGDGGNVRHFAEPPPPPKQEDTGTGSGTGGSGSTGTTDTGTGGSATASSTNQTPQTVVVQQPASTQTPPSGTNRTTSTAPARRTGRLMRNVRVRVVRGRLIITFLLTAPARVAARASTAGHTLGTVGSRLLGRGRRSIVLRYRGKRPPTQLQLIVRPASRATTAERTTR